MSQAEILTILQRHPRRWFSAHDLAHYLPITIASIQTNMHKLMKWTDCVEVRYLSDGRRHYREMKWKT